MQKETMPVYQTLTFSQKWYRMKGRYLLSLPGMVTRFIYSPRSVLHQLSYQVPSLKRLSFSEN